MKRLRTLKRNEIDEHKWNELILSSHNSLPYALSYYLDSVAENWEAIIYNDYEAVMPLVWLRKLGFKCLYQPYYCQQLGVFGQENLSAEIMLDMLTEAQNFPYANINLNPTAKKLADKFSFTTKRNLVLSLNKDYLSIQKKYSENHRRNILKAQRNKLNFSDEMELGQFQKFYLENVNRNKENFKLKHERIFKSLTKILVSNGTGKVFSVFNADKKLVASVLLVLHQKRMISVINTSSVEGKRTGSSHFLFDCIIQRFSGSDNLLDFEGSSIPTIARFYEGFGASEETFYNYNTSIIKKLSQRF